MIDRSREDFYKEHIKRLGYTLQGELGCGDGSITYHVEYGEGYVLQFVRYFQKEKYVLEMKETVQNIKNMTKSRPDLFLCYYEEEELEAASEYEAELMLKIQYGMSLKRYYNVSRFTLRELLEMGIQIAHAQEICAASGVSAPILNPDSIFLLKGQGWRMGNFELSRNTAILNAEKDGDYGMPPEYYEGHAVDETGKVYELGILLYKLMNCMEMPFEDVSQSEWEAEKMRRTAEVPKAPKFGTDSLQKIVCIACSSREKRYHSMKEFRGHLEYLRTNLPQEWLETPIAGHSYKDGDYINRDFEPKAIEEPEISQKPIVESTIEKKQPEKEKPVKTKDKKKVSEEKKKQKEAEKQKQKKQKENEKALKEAQKKQKKAEEAKYGNQNRKDLLMIGGIIIAFIAVIVIVLAVIGNSKNNQIYQYIENAAYGSAMAEMEDLYEEGENIDEVAAAFIDACMSDREYKRIPDAISWLSEEYCTQNEAKFIEIVEQMISSGKETRAEDVLETMEGLEGVRAQYAAAIRQKLASAADSNQ